MRAFGALLAMVALSAEAATLRGTLGDAQERVGLRPAAQFSRFAEHFGTLVTAPSLTSPSSAALAGTAAIDATMEGLGPLFLDHAATLGAGVTNANVVGQRSVAAGSLFGQPFNELGALAPPVLVRRTRTGAAGSPLGLGLRLAYHLDLHVAAAAVAVSHGVTDALDVSLVLPVVSTALDAAIRARVVRATDPAGGAFHAVRGAPAVGGTLPTVSSTGIGDLVVRGKYRLSVPPPVRLAATLEAQFPTGDPLELHGTGGYWVTPGLDAALPVGGTRAELDAEAAIHVNLSHPQQSQALYGLSASAVVWPMRLAAIVEFLGQSQLTTAFAPGDTDVLVLTPQGIAADPLLGVGWSDRLDQFNFSFGLRARVVDSLMIFANGVVPLNRSVGVRPAGVVPTVGIGWSF